MVMPSLAAAEALAAQQIAAEVVNMRFVKPLDEGFWKTSLPASRKSSRSRTTPPSGASAAP